MHSRRFNSCDQRFDYKQLPLLGSVSWRDVDRELARLGDAGLPRADHNGIPKAASLDRGPLLPRTVRQGGEQDYPGDFRHEPTHRCRRVVYPDAVL